MCSLKFFSSHFCKYMSLTFVDIHGHPMTPVTKHEIVHVVTECGQRIVDCMKCPNNGTVSQFWGAADGFDPDTQYWVYCKKKTWTNIIYYGDTGFPTELPIPTSCPLIKK